MNAGQLVYCLLDAEGEYTPEGYRLLDRADAGEYELRLWTGKKHIKGNPVVFNELSLNRRGLSFDRQSQMQKQPGATYALGYRQELLNQITDWIDAHGQLYVGSHDPAKLTLYHKLITHMLPRLQVSAPFPAFDESEDVPDYFTVDTKITEGHEEEDDVDAREFIKKMPRPFDIAKEFIHDYITQSEELAVNMDNYGEQAEDVVRLCMFFLGKWPLREVIEKNYEYFLSYATEIAYARAAAARDDSP
jgi:hypothetical protein